MVIILLLVAISQVFVWYFVGETNGKTKVLSVLCPLVKQSNDLCLEYFNKSIESATKHYRPGDDTR
jgi:hypothetical protein